MVGAPQRARVGIALGAIAVVGLLAIGAALRLEDPTSTSVIPAEDPYTHMALVREHLADGELDPLYETGSLYPPGMHAFIAAAWSYTGADLYDLMRFGPVALGVIGILGMALLLWRNLGAVAGFVGGLAYAVAPEVVFRTTMMAPTAVDLAVVPFLLYALIEMVKGRIGWVGVAAPVSLYLVIAHPWLFGILAGAGAVFLLLTLMMPWPSTRKGEDYVLGTSLAILVVGIAAGIAIIMGAASTLGVSSPLPYRILGLFIGAAASIPYLVVRKDPKRVARWMPGAHRQKTPVWARAAFGIGLGVLLVGITVSALGGGLPEQVDLPRMLGWPILLLGAAAFVALPFMRSPIAYMGAGIAAVTYPFVVFNPLNNPFWPHRTVAFFAIGLVMLVGVAAHGALRLAAWAGTKAASTRLGRPLIGGRRTFGAVLPFLLVLVPLGGGVYAVTPETYDPWYRLYNDCEMDTLQELSDEMQEKEDPIVITGTWHGKTVLSAIHDDADEVWYKVEFFTDPELRQGHIDNFQRDAIPVYVLIDRHFRLEAPEEADTSFLEESPWVQHGAHCAGGGISEPRMKVYRLEGSL